MTTATQADEMLRAVLIDPFDDLARLALADALEEGADATTNAGREAMRQAVAIREGMATGNREKRWWASHGETVELNYDDPFAPAGRLELRSPAWGEIEVAGGMVEGIRCALADWLAHGPALCARWPVVRVEVSDRLAVQDGHYSHEIGFWFRSATIDSGSYLPPDLFAALPVGKWTVEDWRGGALARGYATPEKAAAALSRACVDYARDKAGLPPLPATAK